MISNYLLLLIFYLSLSLLQSKDTTDLRPRGGTNNYTNRGSKGSGDRYAGRGGPNQFSSNGMGLLQGNLV